MRINEKEVRRLADSVVEALLKQGFVRLRVSEKELAERIYGLIRDNLMTEQGIEEEAERLADQHARQLVGMDRRKVVQGIKERLAKERNFPL
jgi:hypothetical protein